jgi:hypothetical protein
MELLKELIQISIDSEEKLFEEQFQSLLEDLGNLKQLKIGSMINAFKQHYGSGGGRGRNQSGPSTGDVGNKFQKKWSAMNIGRDSEVIIGDTAIKSWGAFRREFTKSEKPIVGAVVNLNSKPVATIVVDDTGYFKSKNDVYGIAWDLSKVDLSDEIKEKIVASLAGPDSGYNNETKKSSKFKSDAERARFERFYRSDKVEALKKEGKQAKDKIEVPVKDYETWYDAMKDGGAQLDKTEDYVKASVNGKPMGEWDKKEKKGFFIQYKEAFNSSVEKVYTEVKQIKGIAQTTEDIKRFVEALIENGKVTVDFIIADIEQNKKAQERRERGKPEPVKLSDADMREAKSDLMKRLAFYKASKLDTVKDAKEFLDKVLAGKAKRLNLAGRTYTAIPASKYLGSNDRRGSEPRKSFYEKEMANLIAGKPVTLQFEADRSQNQYDTLYLVVKLVNGTLTPVEARYPVGSKTETFKF